MTPSIATKFQYVNSFLFSFSLTTCFGPYGPKVCLVTNDLHFIYSFNVPFNNGIAKNQYSAVNSRPRKQVTQNLTQNGLEERGVQQKSENYRSKNGNFEKPRQNGQQGETPQQAGPSSGGADNADGKRSWRREAAVNKPNAKCPGNENDLKKQTSAKSHASNGELLEFRIYGEMTVYVSRI
jgi:hypothetical protein